MVQAGTGGHFVALAVTSPRGAVLQYSKIGYAKRSLVR